MLKVETEVGKKLRREQTADLQKQTDRRRSYKLKGGYAELRLFYYGFWSGEEAHFPALLGGRELFGGGSFGGWGYLSRYFLHFSSILSLRSQVSGNIE